MQSILAALQPESHTVQMCCFADVCWVLGARDYCRDTLLIRIPITDFVQVLRSLIEPCSPLIASCLQHCVIQDKG